VFLTSDRTGVREGIVGDVLACDSPLTGDVLDDPPDCLPVDPDEAADRGPVGLRRKPRDQVLSRG
jgi:hypothetical protein